MINKLPESADELLRLMKLGGYQIEVKEDRLIVTPAHAIDDEMIEIIKKYKDDITCYINKSKGLA